MRSAGESTCPICRKTWVVTPEDDCMMPACGCYGFDYSAENPSRPCHQCGVAHAWRCRAAGGTPGAKLPRTKTIYLRK